MNMKKFLLMVAVAIMTTTNASAQAEQRSAWTLNTRAWCTNYFTTAIWDLVTRGVIHFTCDGNEQDSLWAERVIPTADLVFPIGMGKQGFGEDDIYGPIYGPYHYAFGNPFKHIGDYAIGADMSYKPCFVGFYVGTYFKSQEVVFKENKDNIRGFYVQPRVGLIMGSGKRALEAGVFYDILTGSGGSTPNIERKMLQSGIGLDFSLSRTTDDGKSKTLLSFSMPLHNFFNTDYAGQQNLKRKVGYIMLTQRICL